MNDTHRFDMTGIALCGASHGRFSTSGAAGTVTCKECLRLSQPQHREEALAQIEKASARWSWPSIDTQVKAINEARYSPPDASYDWGRDVLGD